MALVDVLIDFLTPLQAIVGKRYLILKFWGMTSRSIKWNA